MSEWWWADKGSSWSEPEGVSSESWGALQGRAPRSPRRRRPCSWAVPVLAPQCGKGKSQRAAAHTVPCRGEDDQRTRHEVVMTCQMSCASWLLHIYRTIQKEEACAAKSDLCQYSFYLLYYCVPDKVEDQIRDTMFHHCQIVCEPIFCLCTADGPYNRTGQIQSSS